MLKVEEVNTKYDVDIKLLTPVIVYPGLVLNTHTSFIEYCRWIKNSFVLSKITIYIHTWEFKENLEALSRLVALLNTYDDFEVKVITEKYNSPQFIDFLSTIDPVNYKDGVLIKRVLVWYSFMRALEQVNKDHSAAYVFKVRSGINFVNLEGYDFKSITMLHLDQLTEFLNLLDYRKINLKSILFTKYTFNGGIDEILLNSSLGFFNDILGSSAIELAFKLKSIYAKYRRAHDNPYTPGLISDRKAPYGGPQILKELVGKFDTSTVSMQSDLYTICTQTLELRDSNNQPISYPTVTLTDDLDYKFFPEHYFPQAVNIKNII